MPKNYHLGDILKKKAARKGAAVFAVSRQERLRKNPVRTLATAGLRRAYYGLLALGIVPEVIKAKTFWGDFIYGPARPAFPVLMDGFLGGSDLLLTNFFIEQLREGDIVVDGGANFGWYTMLASFLVGEAGQVHAFEPTPRTFEALQKNAHQKRNVFPNQVALHNHSGTVSFFDHGRKYEVHNQIPMTEALRHAAEAQAKNPNMRVLTVPAITIDAYCQTHGIVPKLIKLDLEGGEPEAIEGATETLKHHPIVVTEMLGKNRRDARTNKMLQTMQGLGYRPFVLDAVWGLSPYNIEIPVDLADVVFMAGIA